MHRDRIAQHLRAYFLQEASEKRGLRPGVGVLNVLFEDVNLGVDVLNLDDDVSNLAIDVLTLGDDVANVVFDVSDLVFEVPELNSDVPNVDGGPSDLFSENQKAFERGYRRAGRIVFSFGAELTCSRAMATLRRRWTRDELLVALNIYHKLTFGQLHGRQPVIIGLAKKLDRTPDSVAMKLCNFASLDPALKMRGIRGLAGASQLDRQMWAEFHEHLEEAAPASEEEIRKLFAVPAGGTLEVVPKTGIRVRRNPPTGATEITASVKQRRGQEYFRDAVLNNFAGRCGVTALAIRELLVASHILPWRAAEKERLNVRNGLCLSRLHDAAFDTGLITFDENLRLILSRRLKSELSQRVVKESFGAYAGEPLSLPEDAVLPDPEFLAAHYSTIFKKS